MFRGGVQSWNLRDQHMVETLEELTAHLERAHGPAKVAVWEHNSHLGDNRATEVGQAGQLNVGQLVRERHGSDALLVGFTTYTGTVTAASDWGGPAERKHVRRALEPPSVQSGGVDEELWHALLVEQHLPPGERAHLALISHYFHARMAAQFDAVVHLDETHAVEPLERTSLWERGELPETYPWGV
jgi:erythromycin esterase-like protein